MYDGHVIHLWWKSTRGVVANEPHSDLQVSRGATLGRVEAIANLWPDEQKLNTKAHQADKLAKGNEVPKGNRNLDA